MQRLLLAAIAAIATLPVAVAEECNRRQLLSDIAREIGSHTSKANSRYICPVPVASVCSSEGVCQFNHEQRSGIPWSCKWEQLSNTLNTRIKEMLANAKAKSGCSDATAMHCTPSSSGWWVCADRAPKPPNWRMDEPDPEQPADGKCDEGLLLAKLTKHVHNAVKWKCLFIDAVTCQDIKEEKSLCKLGLGHDEVQQCDFSIAKAASEAARSVLKAAAASNGCQVDKKLYCTREPGNKDLSCSFVEKPPKPSRSSEL